MKEISLETQLGINIKSTIDNTGIPLLKMGNLVIGGFNFDKFEKIESDKTINDYKVYC